MKSSNNFQIILKPLNDVYSSPQRVLQTVFFMIIFAYIISGLQNSGQLFEVSKYPLALTEKIRLWQTILVHFYTTNLSLASFFLYTVLIVLLASNITVSIYYFKKRIGHAVNKGVIAGALLGILGTGCAACGGIILSSILGTGLGLGLVTFLPFAGSEFIYVAILILCYSMYRTLVTLAKPQVC